MRSLLLLPAVAVLLSVASCCDDCLTKPDPWTGEVTYACRRWLPERPEASTVVVDIVVSRDEFSPDRVTDAQIESLRHHGASIQHVFNIPMVRAVIPIDSLEAISRGLLDYALGVSFPDWLVIEDLIVGYERPTEQADINSLKALGVTVGEQPWAEALIVTAPDGAIPGIRGLPGVAYVELNGIYCVCAGGTLNDMTGGHIRRRVMGTGIGS